MRLLSDFIPLASTMLCSAASLTCYRYGPWCHEWNWTLNLPTLSGNESAYSACSGDGKDFCIETCPPATKFCFNLHYEPGAKYQVPVTCKNRLEVGMQAGGCFLDSFLYFDGNDCQTSYKDSKRHFCCTTDNCNNRSGSSSQLSTMGTFMVFLVALLPTILSCY
mmetsp:Transcript_9687/g.18379  ORF Transcript_9687/g.18379 Transcript_9687/m.18379 type:complete len:164 (+) Transcript_9687:92-583(+)